MPSSPLNITRNDVSTVQYSQCQVSEAVAQDNRNDVCTLQNRQGHVSVSQDSDGDTTVYDTHLSFLPHHELRLGGETLQEGFTR